MQITGVFKAISLKSVPQKISCKMKIIRKIFQQTKISAKKLFVHRYGQTRERVNNR